LTFWHTFWHSVKHHFRHRGKNVTAEKVMENRLRRIAERRGLQLLKSRRRDVNAIDYGGFMLVDGSTNSAVLGAGPYAYSADLDDVRRFLGDGE
jgi:hypothetical protein